MANEYGEIEQLVNDVTSLDTARMTLRWALERLNSIEKEKADLKKNLALAEETSRSLQVKEATLRDTFDSRNKTVEEKEDFYTKLEATMSLLGEGKLDIQQLLKKEAKLDGLRRSLENEYQEKFEELDHNQRSVIERWNARLLETESQYAGRLAESQVKYDALRAELEHDYQVRINTLQVSFRSKETELTSRISALEASTREKDSKLESRRADLEAQYLSQKREAEENYRKLKNMLEAGLEEKLRSADSDHEAQVLSLENSWKTERSRLLEEQRVRDEQFQTAQAHIKEIENNFASQQEAHHNELLKMIAEQETAFRGQLAKLETEKTAKEVMVKELAAKLELKSSAWDSEKAALEAEFGRKLAGLDSAMREKITQTETEYAGKKEELVVMLAAGRAEFEKEFQARLEMERRALAEEKSRLEAEKNLREEALSAAARKVKELEEVLASSSEEHHKELMAKISSGEAAFREKLAGFQAEKLSYNETINKLADELRLRDSALLDEKKKITAEFDAKAGIYEERLAALEASFEERRRSYDDKVAALSLKLEEAAKASALEKENFKNEVARISAETGVLAEARAASIRGEYESRKVELEHEFESRYGDRVKALETEKARVNEALAERESQLADAYARTAETDAALAEFRRRSADEKTALELKYEAETENTLNAAGEAAAAREAELRAGITTLRENLEEKDRELSAERDRLAAEVAKASSEAHTRGEARVAVIRAEYESRKVELEHEFNSRYGDRVKALETEKARVNEALAEREGQLNVSYAKTAELDGQIAELRRAAAEEKVALSREYSEEMRNTLQQMEEDAKFRENELCSAITVLREELTERDRLLAKEREKLVDELAKASIDAHARSEERAGAVRTEYELRLASLENSADGRIKELKEILAGKETLLEKASAERAAAERALKDVFEVEKNKWMEEKEGLAAGFESRLSERVAAIRADYENRNAGLEQEFEARYGDRVKALELEKSRINDALSEREGQLQASYAKTAELDGAIAELRRAATEEKAALSRKYDQEMRAALKTAEEDAKAREAGLSSAVSSLREELAEKDRLLAQQRENLADELSKASMDAHARSEERAESVRSEYELKLASLEAATADRMLELKKALAEKEDLLEKASAERAAVENALKTAFEGERLAWVQEKQSVVSSFESKASQLEAAHSARSAALENEFAIRRERLESENAAHAASVHAEAAEKIDYERRNWHAERSRFENLLAETSGNFRSAQKEIETLNSGLRTAVEENSARETRFNRELMEVRANYERELSFRISDAVYVQTAHLAEALEAAKAKNEELAGALAENDNSLRTFKAEAEEMRRDLEERLRTSDSEALAARRAELEKAYAQKHARLEANLAALKKEFESDFQAHRGELEGAFAIKNERLETENRALKESVENIRASEEASSKRAAGIFNEMLAAAEAAQLEKMKLQQEHSENLNRAMAATVRRITESAEEKLRMTQAELIKAQENNKDEVQLLEESFNSEKERMIAELSRRDKYIETADIKMQEMEMDIMKYRQNASGELIKQIAEQDERFQEVVRAEKERREVRERAFEAELGKAKADSDARVKQLTDLLAAKEKLMADEDRIYRQKQLELDGMHSDMNLRVNKLNEDLFEQKQALGEKEKELNDYRLKLEKEYAAKTAETEKMRAELSRAIMEYKSRK